jgi:competence protein ComEC
MGEYLNFLPERIQSFASHLASIARTSLIATAATMPFAIYHFQSVSLYGFIANMAAIPVTSFWIMPSILLAYLTAPLGYDGIFIDAAGLGVALTIRIATTVSAWPHSIFYCPAMPDFALIAIVLGGLWLCLWREKWRYTGLLPILIGMIYPLYTPHPDFFVSPNGKAWASVLDDGRLAVSNVKREKFAVTQWRERLGNVDMIDAKALPPDTRQIRCDDQGCVARRKGTLIAMPIAETAALEDCDHADIVIASFAIRSCAAKSIDREALDAHGAYAVTFDGNKPRIEFSRKGKGARPWSVGWRDGNEEKEEKEEE